MVVGTRVYMVCRHLGVEARAGAEALGQELETKDEVTAAVQALARCHLDLSKHLAAKDARGGAIAEARKALKLDRDATSEVRPLCMACI